MERFMELECGAFWTRVRNPLCKCCQTHRTKHYQFLTKLTPFSSSYKTHEACFHAVKILAVSRIQIRHLISY